ncbi:MAG: hypothetical protein CR997_10020 [Acidobacteria bacterium]|nr:MAG: hypothetical protein CR997_10020 [Acidobacteriota bacterium]
MKQSDAVDFYIKRMEEVVSSHENSGDHQKFPEEALLEQLTRLKRAYSRSVHTLIHSREWPHLDVETRNEPVFGGRMTLPAENKQGQFWAFEWQKMPVLPDHLWMYGFSFRGKRTIRVKAVKVFFGNGKSKLFDSWSKADRGNGRVFKADQWLPFFEFSDARGNRCTKRLKAVHILGSAQDADKEAKLDFLFRIPDPKLDKQMPLLQELDKIQKLLQEKKYDQFIAAFRRWVEKAALERRTAIVKDSLVPVVGN